MRQSPKYGPDPVGVDTAMARSITDPGWKVDALAEVGGVLVARGDTKRAQHLASAACAVGRWIKVLGLVLSLEPSAARVLTEVQ